MFDVGFWELVVIAVVALLVVGPEKLPALARAAGHWLARGQRLARDFRHDVERELAIDEIRAMKREIPSLPKLADVLGADPLGADPLGTDPLAGGAVGGTGAAGGAVTPCAPGDVTPGDGAPPAPPGDNTGPTPAAPAEGAPAVSLAKDPDPLATDVTEGRSGRAGP